MPKKWPKPGVDELFLAVEFELAALKEKKIDQLNIDQRGNVMELPHLHHLIDVVKSKAPRFVAEGSLYKRFFNLMRKLDEVGMVRTEVFGKALDVINHEFGRNIDGPCPIDISDLTRFHRPSHELPHALPEAISFLPRVHKRGSNYFALGTFPTMQTISDPHHFRADFLEFLEVTMGCRYRIDHILIGDEAGFFTAMNHLRGLGAVSIYLDGGDRRVDFLDEREKAEATGLQSQFLIQSMQEVLLRKQENKVEMDFYDPYDRPRSTYRPTVRMSELIDIHPRVREIFAVLAEKVKEDKLLANMLWKCVPPKVKKMIFGEKLGGKNYKKFCKAVDKITGEKGGGALFAAEIMGYALLQIAFVLYWGGTKFGFEGERKFDEATQYCFKNYADELDLDEISRGLQFVYLDGTNNVPVPYQGFPEGEANVLTNSIHQSCEEEVDLEFSLNRFCKKHLPTYRAFLTRIELSRQFHARNGETSQTGKRSRDCMLDIESFKLISNLTKELSRESILAKALEDSGLAEILSRKSSLMNWLKEGKIETLETTQKLEKYRSERRAKYKIKLESSLPSIINGMLNKRARYNLSVDDIDMGDKWNTGLHDFKLETGEFGSFYLMRHLAEAIRGDLQDFPELIEPIETILHTIAEIMYPGGSKYIKLRPEPETWPAAA